MDIVRCDFAECRYSRFNHSDNKYYCQNAKSRSECVDVARKVFCMNSREVEIDEQKGTD